MQLESVFPVTRVLVQWSGEFVLNQENSLSVRVGVVFAAAIAGLVAVLLDIATSSLRGGMKVIELLGIFHTENVRTAFYGRLKAEGEQGEEYLFVPSETGFTMWISDGSNKTFSLDEIEKLVVKLREAVSSPKRLGNRDNDCFLNSLFQLIMAEDLAFQQAICEKHPFLTSYMGNYRAQEEGDEPLFLNPIRFNLSEISRSQDWKTGQHDPVEVFNYLTDEWEASPHRMQVMNTENHGNRILVLKEEPMHANICALGIPPKEARETSIPFIKLLENFQAPSREEERFFSGTKKCWQRPPNYLTFQINRNADGNKVNDLIDIPEEISLEPKYFVENQESPISYELSPGFIIHSDLGMLWGGSSAESGHYTAYISKPIDEKRPELGKQYFLCDDSYIKTISKEEYLKKAQYACFLILKKK